MTLNSHSPLDRLPLRLIVLVSIAAFFIMFSAGCVYWPWPSYSGGAGMSGYPSQSQKEQQAFEKDLAKSLK